MVILTAHYHTLLKLKSPRLHDPPQEGDIKILKTDILRKDTHPDGKIFSGVEKNEITPNGEVAEAVVENHSWPLDVTFTGQCAIYSKTNSIALAPIKQEFSCGKPTQVSIPNGVTKLTGGGKTTSGKGFSFEVDLTPKELKACKEFGPVRLASCQRAKAELILLFAPAQ